MYFLREIDLSAITPEIPGGVEYGLVDKFNPAPEGAKLFEGDDALAQVEAEAEAITQRQIDAAVAAAGSDTLVDLIRGFDGDDFAALARKTIAKEVRALADEMGVDRGSEADMLAAISVRLQQES